MGLTGGGKSSDMERTGSTEFSTNSEMEWRLMSVGMEAGGTYRGQGCKKFHIIALLRIWNCVMG